MTSTSTGQRGSVKKDASGRWGFVVDLPSLDGRRRQARRRGFASKREAQAELDRVKAQVADAAYVAPSRETFAAFVEEAWLPEVRAQLRPATYASYARVLRLRVLPAIGGHKLQAITGPMLTRLYLDLLEDGMRDAGKRDNGKRGLSVRSVRYTHTIIGAALGAAVEHGLIVRNPAQLAKPPKASAAADGTAPMQVWTASELGRFLAAELGKREHPLWLLLATTGMRRGEGLGIGWEHLDLDAGAARVQRTLVDVLDADGDRPVWSDPKTASGRRTVALDAGTVAALRAHKAAQAAERLLVGPGYVDHGLVFAMPDGRPYHPERLSRTFKARAKRAGVPVIRLHDLRHTWATLALEVDVSPRVVQERLGHANVSITLGVYSHVRPAMQADAAERVAALFR